MTSQSDRERQEIEYWARSPTEAPGSDSLEVLTNKMSEARVLLEKFAAFSDTFQAAQVIVEVGGGQGWAAALVKAQFGPDKTVICSDLAADALVSSPRWERIVGVRLDGRVAARSSALPLVTASVDLVVVFAAAHHFGAHRRTCGEIARILKPGGRALYLHEPACRAYLYPWALRRVNCKRPEVPEDVLRYRHLVSLAADEGLVATVHHAPTTTYRGPVETLYYLLLSKIPGLRHVLPCSVDIVFQKSPAGGQREAQRIRAREALGRA